MMQYLFTKTPLAFFVMDLWRDEAFSFVMAQQGILEILQTTAIDFNPPLYYLILHYWMMMFGTTEIALRSLSLVFFGGTLFLLFEIMRDVLKIPYRRAFFYFLFLVLNPFLLFYAFEARMYSMIVFLTTLSYYAFWTKKRKLYIIAISLALYTHYFSVFILSIQALEYGIRHFNSIFSWQYFSSKTKSWNIFDRKMLQDISMFAIPVFIFIPWTAFLLKIHNFHSEDFWIIKPPVHDLLFLPFVLFTGYERVFGKYYHADAGYTDFHSYINALLIFLIALPIVTVVMGFLSKRINTLTQHAFPNKPLFSLYLWAFVAPVSIFVLSLLTTPLYHPRYFIFSVPGFLLILIVSYEFLVTQIRSSLQYYKHYVRSSVFNNTISLVLLFTLLLFTYSITQKYNRLNLQYHYKKDVSGLYQEIMYIKKPGEPIYLTSELDYHLAQYYTRSPDIFIFNKRYDEIPDYVGKVLIPEEKVTSNKPLYPHRAFVVYYDSFDIYSEM